MNMKRIRALCRERKTSIAALEAAVGLSNGTIGRWGISAPRITSLQAVADYFGVTVGYLMGEDEPNNPLCEHQPDGA